MSSSTTHFDQPVPHSPLRAWFLAWCAVHDGVHIEVYLEFRLRLYQSKGRRSSHPLPFTITIVQSRIVCTPNPHFESYWEKLRDDSGERGVQFLTALEMQEILREVGQLEEEIQEVTHRLRELIEKIEQLEMEEAEAILRGEKQGKRTCERHLKEQRPPRLPFPWAPVARYLSIALLVLVEAFLLTMPLLDFLGIDTGNLSAEWVRNPIALLGGVASAIAVTACLILPWHLLIKNAVAISTSWSTAGPPALGLRLLAMLFLLVILLSGTIGIANLRHGMAEGVSRFHDLNSGQNAASQTGSGVFLFLTFLMPAAAAYLQHKITQSAYWQRRADILAEQARFDRNEDERLSASERFADAIDIWQRKRAQIEGKQAQLRAKRAALADRVLSAQRERLEMLTQARLATETYALSLLAALEADNFHFRRAAYRCQAMHLVAEEAACQSQEPVPHQQSVRPLLPTSGNGHRP